MHQFISVLLFNMSIDYNRTFFVAGFRMWTIPLSSKHRKSSFFFLRALDPKVIELTATTPTPCNQPIVTYTKQPWCGSIHLCASRVGSAFLIILEAAQVILPDYLSPGGWGQTWINSNVSRIQGNSNSKWRLTSITAWNSTMFTIKWNIIKYLILLR